MSFAIVHSRAVSGIDALPVRVEADLANGLPCFSIVGLPDAAVREARDRVRAAIQNSGYEFPQRRITVNLAPADLPKDSGRFDLPIAIGILAASGQIPANALKKWEFAGELSLNGHLLAVRAAFALAASTLKPDQNQGRALLLPHANQAEAELSESQRLGFATDLSQVAEFLSGKSGLLGPTETAGSKNSGRQTPLLDFSDVQGQALARRAAEVSVAGRHNFLMMGPPGVGKSMIASRMAGLLPPLSHAQACALASILSLDQGVDPDAWRQPPYRAPHHSTPSRALIGGGQPIRPGEISMAHHGILFLDELPEFSRDALEALREPLETMEVSIARVRARLRLPADFILVAAMNPCPCGYFGVQHPRRHCKCTPDRVSRYRSKISGPLLDRFDLAIGLEPGPKESSADEPTTNKTQRPEASETMAIRVALAQTRQADRQRRPNARLSPRQVHEVARLDPQGAQLFEKTAQHWGWSARARDRTLRVARTIADLAQSEDIDLAHLGEAIELRRALDLAAGV